MLNAFLAWTNLNASLLAAWGLGALTVLLVWLIASLWQGRRTAYERSRLALLEGQADERQALSERLSQAQQALAAAEQNITHLELQNARERELLGGIQRQVEERFANLAHQAVQKTQEGLMTQAREDLARQRLQSQEDLDQRTRAVEKLVKPLEAQLQAMGKEQAALHGALNQRLTDLAQSSARVSQQAQSLSDALRHAPKTRGNWGEMQLRNVLELAGLLQHVDFSEQVQVRDEFGKAQRPDALIRLPGGRSLVLDAKTPLTGFLAAYEAQSEEARIAGLSAHADAVRKQADELAKSSYWKLFDQAPDFVILYLPGENYYTAAIGHDPELFDRALSKGVLIVGPTALLALAKAVAYSWRQEALVDNARAIGKLGKDLYEALRVLGGHYADVGRHLGRSVDAYNKMVGSVELNLLPKARRFSELQDLNPLETLEDLDPRSQAVRQLSAPDFQTKEP